MNFASATMELTHRNRRVDSVLFFHVSWSESLGGAHHWRDRPTWLRRVVATCLVFDFLPAWEWILQEKSKADAKCILTKYAEKIERRREMHFDQPPAKNPTPTRNKHIVHRLGTFTQPNRIRNMSDHSMNCKTMFLPLSLSYIEYALSKLGTFSAK